MPHRKAKRSRDSSKHAPCVRQSIGKSHADFMISLPKDKDIAANTLVIQQILNRLEFLGYSEIALVHQVYGSPTGIKVDQIFEPYEQLINSKTKKRPNRTIKIYRRLHAIIENQSDLSYFNDPKLLDSYDLVSIAPSNESIFQAACTCVAVDLITLDYSRNGLSYKVRPTNVQVAINNNIALEVLYGQAIVSVSQAGKHFVQTLRALETASVGKKPKLVVSSGCGGSSSGNILALRSPGDIANVMETVALVDPVRARGAMAATWLLEAAFERRFPKKNPRGNISIQLGMDEVEVEVEDPEKKKPIDTVDTPKSGTENTGGGLEDGFITL